MKFYLQIIELIKRWFFTPKPTIDSGLLEVMKQQTELMRESMLTVKEMTLASAAQAKALSDWLALFKVDSAPVSRTMRDSDEYRNELARRGYPLTGTPEEQAQWVLRSSE